jgi:hypothetical protein
VIVSLVPRTDFAPVPRVEIRIEPLLQYQGGDAFTTGDELSGGDASSTGLPLQGGSASTVAVDVPEGTDRVTLWRRSEGRAFKVRGAVRRVFTGGGGFQDFEAGFDTTSAYELECFDGDLPLGRVSFGTTVLPHFGDPADVLVQQPLNPHLNVVLGATWHHGHSIDRVAPGGPVRLQQRSLPTLVGADVRSGVATQVHLEAGTRAAAEAAWATLGTEDEPQTPVWLIRGVHPLIPRVAFFDATTVEEVDYDLSMGGTRSRFVLATGEVAPPAPGLVVSPLSYNDLDASFSSYDEMDAAFVSYDARDSAWEYAGAAGGS